MNSDLELEADEQSKGKELGLPVQLYSSTFPARGIFLFRDYPWHSVIIYRSVSGVYSGIPACRSHNILDLRTWITELSAMFYIIQDLRIRHNTTVQPLEKLRILRNSFKYVRVIVHCKMFSSV